MKKTLILLSIVVFLTCGFAFAQEVKTIKGEVVDISCYVTAGAKGVDHKACALACVQAGEPAGILEEGTGKVYVVISEDHAMNPSTKVLPFIAKTVEVTGSVSERGGVAVVDIKDIKEIAAPSMEAGMPMMKEKQKRAGY